MLSKYMLISCSQFQVRTVAIAWRTTGCKTTQQFCEYIILIEVSKIVEWGSIIMGFICQRRCFACYAKLRTPTTDRSAPVYFEQRLCGCVRLFLPCLYFRTSSFSILREQPVLNVWVPFSLFRRIYRSRIVRHRHQLATEVHRVERCSDLAPQRHRQVELPLGPI